MQLHQQIPEKQGEQQKWPKVRRAVGGAGLEISVARLSTPQYSSPDLFYPIENELDVSVSAVASSSVEYLGEPTCLYMVTKQSQPFREPKASPPTLSLCLFDAINFWVLV